MRILDIFNSEYTGMGKHVLPSLIHLGAEAFEKFWKKKWANKKTTTKNIVIMLL